MPAGLRCDFSDLLVAECAHCRGVSHLGGRSRADRLAEAVRGPCPWTPQWPVDEDGTPLLADPFPLPRQVYVTVVFPGSRRNYVYTALSGPQEGDAVAVPATPWNAEGAVAWVVSVESQRPARARDMELRPVLRVIPRREWHLFGLAS